MKKSLWVVIAIVAANVGFLVGYSVSSYSGYRQLDADRRAAAAAAGGGAAPAYGAPAAAPAPAYGAPAPAYGADPKPQGEHH
jgi:hypothetical protein